MKLLKVGAVNFACFAGAFTLIPMAASRQAMLLRRAYIRAVLRQDMAFFDSLLPGAIVSAANDDVQQVENGISQKLVELLWGISQLIGGFTIAFFKSWKLSVVVIACVPLLGVAAAIMTKSGGAGSSRAKASYDKAGAIASETLSSMRTVASFGGEPLVAQKYGSHLVKAQNAATRAGIFVAFGSSLLFAVMFSMYGLGYVHLKHRAPHEQRPIRPHFPHSSNTHTTVPIVYMLQILVRRSAHFRFSRAGSEGLSGPGLEQNRV